MTSPPVARAIFSATSRDGQPLPSQREVIQPAETSIWRAKSPRLMPLDSRYSANRMGEAFSLTKTLVQEKFQFGCVDRGAVPVPHFGVTKKSSKTVKSRLKRKPLHPTFIRQWRKFRGLTQERLADRVGMSNGNLSEIENGNTAYTQETLEAFADALQCTPADLLMRNPTDPEGIWSLWDQAKPAERNQLIEMIKGFLRARA